MTTNTRGFGPRTDFGSTVDAGPRTKDGPVPSHDHYGAAMEAALEMARPQTNQVQRAQAREQSQADRLGEVGLDWMRGRLGLRLEMDSDGDISLAPRVDETE